MEKTLVTGATGLIGNSIAAALREAGRPVRAVVRSVEKAKKLLPEEVELVPGDVTDRASIERAMEGCSVVYHAAGLPEQWLSDAQTFDRVNAGGSKNVAEVALARRAKMLYTSTIDVFAAKRGEEFDESQIDPHPKGTAYERSKQEADRQVAALVARGLDAVFLHPSALYGPGPAGSPGLNDFIEKLRDGKVPMLIPGGMPVVYSPDVGRGHMLAEKAKSGSRYILSEKYYELPVMAEIIGRELGLEKIPGVMPVGLAKVVAGVGEAFSGLTKKPPLIPKGQLHFLQWGAKPKSERAQRELGWNPTPFAEGVKLTVAYLMNKSGAWQCAALRP